MPENSVPKPIPLLRVKDLNISFTSESGTTAALKNMNYSLSAGESLAVVGESGSGKTVHSLALLRLLPANAEITGQIFFKETDVMQMGGPALRAYRGGKAAMVFQDPYSALNPVMTIGRQIEEAVLAHKKSDKKSAREEVIKLLEETAIPDAAQKLNMYPHEFSGGQRQRIVIAMALAAGPEILIADEPTTALDVTIQAQIISLIKKIQKQRNTALIFITHNLALAYNAAEKVIVLQKGETVEAGNIKEVFSSPKAKYTKELLSAVIKSENGPNNAVLPPDFILTTEKLEKTYFKKRLFSRPAPFWSMENINISLKKGGVLGVVGESGSGKTTLAKILLGLENPTAGKVVFGGKDIFSLSRKERKEMRRHIQAVFQDPYMSLDPRQTIGSIIEEPLVIHNIFDSKEKRQKRVAELLEAVGLPGGILRRYPHEFSGGQRQRIAIARALALSPKVLIADEPTSALDVSVQAQILALLKEIKEKFDLSIILITHDLDVARFLCDEVVVMQDGKAVEAGAADAVFNNPKSEYTKTLLAARPVLRLSV